MTEIVETSGIKVTQPDITGTVDPIFLWSMNTYYPPIQAMRDSAEGKEPPLRVQVARCDSREVKRIFVESYRKFKGDMLDLFQQEFVRLCKEDGLISQK